MSSEIISLPRTAASPAGSLLTRLAASAPGVTVKYSHTGKLTIFSRWLAINRGRHSTRFRHTRKQVEQVVLKEADLDLTKSGVACFDNGEKLAYFLVAEGAHSPIEDDSTIADLKKDQYLLWHL